MAWSNTIYVGMDHRSFVMRFVVLEANLLEFGALLKCFVWVRIWCIRLGMSITSPWWSTIVWPPSSNLFGTSCECCKQPSYSRHNQCSRLKSSMPFKRDLCLQNIPLSKQAFKVQPQIETWDVTWSPQYNLHAIRTNKRRALPLQEVELDGWFLILHIILETCTTWFMQKFNMSLVFSFYILGLASWIWTNPSTEGVKLESPSKWNYYEGFNLEHCTQTTMSSSNSLKISSSVSVFIPKIYSCPSPH